jgi:outer membrane assembly lipoprotein YfgL
VKRLQRLSLGLTGLLLAAWLAACSSTPSKPQPGPLPLVVGGMNAGQAWSYRFAPTGSPLQATAIGNRVLLASVEGLLAEIDADTGREVWRLQLPQPLTAGIGSDGRRHAVVTSGNELVVVQEGREIWRQRLGALSYTTPLVAGERVFVQTADRTVWAFDGAGGQRLWTLPRNADPLVLRQSGVLTAVGDTLLAGNGGRLSAIQPSNGQLRWEVVMGTSRGTNEVERLVDLVAGVSRQGQTVCVRSFQTVVGCVDASRGLSLWTRPSQGHEGLDGDEVRVYGTESDSKLRAWDRKDGQLLWSQDDYRFRDLTGPRVWGPALALGDGQGHLHLLSRQDGRTLQRLATDGTAIGQRPVVAGRTLVTVNRSGLVTGWRFD